MSKEIDPMRGLRHLSEYELSDARDLLISEFSMLFPQIASDLGIVVEEQALKAEDLLSEDPFGVRPFAGIYRFANGQITEAYFGKKPAVDVLDDVQSLHSAA